ncbi:XRE family transcriptional regulator [Gordonia cholesterolivorans]|uniref:HTH cro/C1-type domain-containing protein n=1 Tax=Gordonia cholesterolivorans TaxID=559625 RepID=A0ABN3HT21_9ACTN
MKRTSQSPAAGTDFDGTRLTVARRLRRKTKATLAREVGVTPTAIGQFEKNLSNPTQSVLAQLCLQLGLPRDFFGAGRPLALLPASGAHFRSLRSTSAAAREQALAYGELCLELVDLIGAYVDLPPVSLPEFELPEELSDDDIAEAARLTRQAWSIEPGPIASVVQALEAHGVIALRLPERTDAAVDAFSTYSGSRPLVFLSPTKDDKARSRFDAAHELGHLVLHPDTEPGSKLVEQEANRFAAEFLMPRDEIIDDLPRRIDWPTFHDLKRHWGVSLRALVFRAHTLGRLSDASYRRANQQLSIWGFPEPGPLGPAESPQVLGMARQLITDSGYDFADIMAAGRVAPEVAESVMDAASNDRPKLRFV